MTWHRAARRSRTRRSPRALIATLTAASAGCFVDGGADSQASDAGTTAGASANTTGDASAGPSAGPASGSESSSVTATTTTTTGGTECPMGQLGCPCAAQEPACEDELLICVGDECVMADVCGNGLLEGEESCDDGNAIDGDGCNNDCLESGRLLWSVTVDGPGALDDGAHDVAVDGAGWIYVAGFHHDAASEDIWVRRYSPEGAPDWSYTFLENTGLPDQARGITLTDAGDVLVAGFVTAQDGDKTPTDGWIHKLGGADGLPLWDAPAIYAGPQDDDRFEDIVLATDSTIVASGYANYQGQRAPLVSFRLNDGQPKYNELQIEPYPGELNGVTTSINHIVSCGRRDLGDSVRGLTRSYKQGQIDEEVFAPGDGWTYTATSCVFDPISGQLLTVASGKGPAMSGGQHDLVTYDYNDADGQLEFSGNETVLGRAAMGLTVDPQTGARVTCGRTLVNNNPGELWVRRAPADDYTNALWEYTLAPEGADDSVCEQVALDPAGNIIAVGRHATANNGTDIWVAKFSP